MSSSSGSGAASERGYASSCSTARRRCRGTCGACPRWSRSGDQPAASGRFQDGAFELLVEEPGWYRLRVPQVEGYRAVPVKEILLERGELREQRVALERER